MKTFKQTIFDKNRDTAGCLNHNSIHTFQLLLILGQKFNKHKQNPRADDGTNYFQLKMKTFFKKNKTYF